MSIKDIHVPAWASLSAMSLIAPGWVDEQVKAEQTLHELCALTGKTADEILAAFRASPLCFADFASELAAGVYGNYDLGHRR